MADGDPYNSARKCKEAACERAVAPGQGFHRYCPEHSAPRARRGPYVHYSKPCVPRPESAIRADLAAQLTAQVRRFASMVAHDRATDPLR